jgi:hypothetical protein
MNIEPEEEFDFALDPRVPHVYAHPAGSTDTFDVPLRAVKFLDISEDLYGRDVVTFEYDGEVQQSTVFLTIDTSN